LLRNEQMQCPPPPSSPSSMYNFTCDQEFTLRICVILSVFKKIEPPNVCHVSHYTLSLHCRGSSFRRFFVVVIRASLNSAPKRGPRSTGDRMLHFTSCFLRANMQSALTCSKVRKEIMIPFAAYILENKPCLVKENALVDCRSFMYCTEYIF
jgi:hypothetical protein